MTTTGGDTTATHGTQQKPATAARMYDYFLGGYHNFPADRKAAEAIIAQAPQFPMWARMNRGFLRRAVRYLVEEAGVRQFLDIGSGIPTVGNVHEIAQQIAPDSRVVYVDIDSVAVAESLEILDGNELATAIRADLRNPRAILDHVQVRRLLDFDRPIGLLLAAVLHFTPRDVEAYGAVAELVSALAPGSHLAISHVAAETLPPASDRTKAAVGIYERNTTSSGKPRDHADIERFFAGLNLIEPGVVWLHQWRPDPDDPTETPEVATDAGEWCAVGRKN